MSLHSKFCFFRLSDISAKYAKYALLKFAAVNVLKTTFSREMKTKSKSCSQKEYLNLFQQKLMDFKYLTNCIPMNTLYKSMNIL